MGENCHEDLFGLMSGTWVSFGGAEGRLPSEFFGAGIFSLWRGTAVAVRGKSAITEPTFFAPLRGRKFGSVQSCSSRLVRGTGYLVRSSYYINQVFAVGLLCVGPQDLQRFAKFRQHVIFWYARWESTTTACIQGDDQ